MFITELKIGDIVYLHKMYPDGTDIILSEHTVTKVLKTRIYVTGFDRFFYKSGGRPYTNWSEYLVK